MEFDLEKIEDSDHLLDVLLQLEDLIDSLDGYVYQNWIEGEVIEGPIIKRHWVSFSLLYPYKKMPDPRFILRLLKHNVKCDFSKVDKEGNEHDKVEAAKKKDDEHLNTFWKVKLTVPRRLLDQISNDLEEYDDEVDVDDIEDAKDSGLDNSAEAYKNDDVEGGFDDASAPTLPDQQ